MMGAGMSEKANKKVNKITARYLKKTGGLLNDVKSPFDARSACWIL